MHKTVLIDCFERGLPHYLEGHAIVAVDVVRATTTAITAAAIGRTCFVVPSLTMAFELAKRMRDPLLAGEQLGVMPSGFHINNSPAELSTRTDVDRPVILLSSSGTRLCHEAAKFKVALLACLRNYLAVAAYLERFDKVALIGAATGSEFREEDQICCARIAHRLFDAGYSPANFATSDIVRRWQNRSVTAWLDGKSASYLRRSGQTADIDFILHHVGDVDFAVMLRDTRVVAAPNFCAPLDKKLGAFGVSI